MPTRKVINPQATAGTLKFAATEGGLAAGTDASGQVTNFEVIPAPNLISAPATLGNRASRSAGLSDYAIKVDFLQDWGQAGSISKYMYDNEGETVWFEYNPAGATEDSFKGQCDVVGAKYGGPSDGNWTDSVTMPCPSKPTRVNAA